MHEAYICNFADGNSLYLVEDNFENIKTTFKKKFHSYKRGFMKITCS